MRQVEVSSKVPEFAGEKRSHAEGRKLRAIFRFWLPLGGLCLLAYMFATSDWAVRKVQSLSEAAPELMQNPFEVRELRISGRRYTPKEAIVAATGFVPGEGLSDNAAAIRQRLLGLPWVAEAEVTFQSPNALLVRMTEREAVALWQHNGVFRLIDRAGNVISEAEDRVRYGSLPLLVGAGANLAVEEALRIRWAVPRALDVRILALNRIGQRRWDVELSDNLRVKLPEEAPVVALRHLYELHLRHDLMSLGGVQHIDMRLPTEFAVRLRAPVSE